MTRSLAALFAAVASLAPQVVAAQEEVGAPLPEPRIVTLADLIAVDEDRARIASPDPVVSPRDPLADRQAVRAQLAAQRQAHLAELRRYVDEGVFPTNTYARGLVNVFEDEEGHLCAVANLMARDGQLEMVRRTAQSTNFVRLVDVHEGPLHDWILASGFTQEEIGRIQVPYMEMDRDREPRAMRSALEREKRRLRGALGRVIRQLERRDARSLETAVDRLLASRGIETVAARPHARRRALVRRS